ncbi:adenosylcobinamide-phosphate synthase CbiB [Paracoccaceae bacterium]|nr:adenosylcobinamide-phosphate synthase CbiB [Paracoccaceae bacterium]
MYSEIYFMIPLILLLALTLDIVIGWPEKIYANIGHPVSWIGKVISYFERSLNKREYPGELRKLLGTLTFFLTVVPITVVAFLVDKMLINFHYGFFMQAILIWPFLATKSLYTHVKDVADALDKKDLIASREALSKIVGRDLTNSDENTICGGAIESLSENTSDGIISPLFWAFLFGLPGIVFYKTVNTLDSMIGYRNDKFLNFGWFSAKVDDFVNWVPARLSSILVCFLTLKPIKTFLFSFKNAKASTSPNAGWPQATFAYVLGVSLLGPKRSKGVLIEQPTINIGQPLPGKENLSTALKYYICIIIEIYVILLALNFWFMNG